METTYEDFFMEKQRLRYCAIKVKDAKEQLTDAAITLDQAIAEARDKGMTLRAIEKHVGVSNVSVLNAERRARGRTDEP